MSAFGLDVRPLKITFYPVLLLPLSFRPYNLFAFLCSLNHLSSLNKLLF